MQENTMQNVATSIATTAAQGFLEVIPDHIRQALCPSFLTNLEADLLAQIQAVIQSQFAWSMQSVNLELVEQRRLQELRAATPAPAQPEPILQPLVPTPQIQVKHRSTKPKKVLELQKVSLPAPAAVVTEEALVREPEIATPLHSNQLEFPGMSEPQSLKPRRRRRIASEEVAHRETLNTYNTTPSDHASRPAEAGRRRRRTSIATG